MGEVKADILGTVRMSPIVGEGKANILGMLGDKGSMVGEVEALILEMVGMTIPWWGKWRLTSLEWWDDNTMVGKMEADILGMGMTLPWRGRWRLTSLE